MMIAASAGVADSGMVVVVVVEGKISNMELKQRRRRRRRQREREKSNRFRLVKKTTLPSHHAFLYISLPSLHDHNVKVPNFTFCRGREHMRQQLSFSFP